MKALILVGGYGTRLRPLTLSLPKPLIAFCNRTIVEHQIEALVAAGVQHVVLAVAYRPDAMQTALESLERRLGVKISCSQEPEPLGTAGPIKLAESLLMTPDDGDMSKPEAEVLEESFFVCNSDIICEFPLEELKSFHKAHGKEGTILVTEVKDPSKFGVVVTKADGAVERFVEKPTEYVGNTINAGFYILKKKVIPRIEARPTSIEREIFPMIANDNQLAAMKINGYWADIGQPKDYLSGIKLHLDFLRRKSLVADADDLKQPEYSPTGSRTIQLSDTLQSLDSSPLDTTFVDHPCVAKLVDRNSQIIAHSRKLASGEGVIDNVLIHPTSKIGQQCSIGPNVTVSAGCVIGDGVRLKNCAVMEGTVIGDYSCVLGSIVGWKCKIGKWCRMENLTVLGEDVEVGRECFVNGALVLPHKQINTSIYEVGQILM